MINISSLIKLDEYTNIIPLPRLQLMTRSFEIIGNISHYSDWRVSIRGNELDEISFTVTKYVNGVLNPIWDDIVDLKIVSLEKGGKFEIQVTYTDESKTTKSVSGVSLETELGQVALYEFHVNDDDYDAMEMEKHGEIVPTVLYDPTRPDYSLIHRVLKDKTPHWTINDAKMPEYILVAEDREPEAVNTFQRQFTVDGTSIYDFLTGDVAKEANIVFRFDTDQRKLWFEPLLDYYDEHDQHIVDAIGEDTTILVSKRKLGNEITINSNKDSVKNCFRVEGGDDLINSQIAVLNMTGDNYIYHFADFQLADMPEDLREAVIHYSSWLDTYRDEYYGTVEEQGADGLYTQFTKANAQLYYLEHEMAPAVSPEPEVATPQAMWEKIKAIMDISQGHQIVGVADLNYITSSAFAGATNNVETMAQIDASDSRYKVEVVKDTTSYTDATHVWSGVIRVTRVSDTTQFYPPIVDNPSLYDQYKFNIEVREDTDTDLWYTRQKVEIALHKGEMSRVDAEFNDQTTPEEMERYFRQWNLTKLKSFSDGYDSCISTIMSGKSYQEREIAKGLYDVYKTRLDVLKGKLIDGVIVGGVLNERQAQVDEQQAIVDRLAGYTDDNGEYQKGELQKFQESKSFIYYLTNDTPDHERGIPVYTQAEADEMFKIYRSYIREDQYQNSNFVSDTYETDQNELIKVAKELLTDAEKEIKKSCVLQRTMTVNVNNLLALPEFKPLYDKFDLFNYIRVRTDDEILKLRLIGIDYSGDSMQSVEVTFSDQIETVDGNVSDLQSVLDQAKSIATSYNAVTLQASKGAEAQGYVINIVQNGLDAANTMLKNSNDNEVTISRAGIIAKRMDNEGEYGQKQLRIIGNGMYMTEDAWDSVAMAVGEITVPSLNDGKPMYGVIADAIVGRFIAGNSLYIGNEEGSVAIDGDGITITNGTITWDPTHEDGVNPPEIEDIPDLADTLEDLEHQVDGKIDTYYQALEPHSEHEGVEDNEEYNKDVGDLWYDTTNDKSFMYVKETVVPATTPTTYNYIWKESDGVPDEVYDKIDGKNTIYSTYPTDPQTGDLLIPASDITVGQTTYKAKKVYKYTGSSFVEIDYTDDSYVLNWIGTTYTTDKNNLQSQIDGKVDTFYQSTKPHQEYTGIQDNIEYNKWIGDLWYDTMNNKSFMYRKEEVTPSTTPATYNYKWEESDGVPQSVYDEIDGKNTIYMTYPTAPQSGDLLIPSTDITYSSVTYYAGKVYRYNGSSFDEVDYTDDSALTTFLTDTYAPDKVRWDGKADTWYCTQAEIEATTATWTTAALKQSHEGDIWYCTGITSGSTLYIVGHSYMYGSSSGTYAWREVDGVPKSVFDTIDGKRTIYTSKPETLQDDGYYYRQGDMWVLSSDTTLSGVTYSAQTILYASADNTTGFDPTQWSPTTTKSAEDALDQISALDGDYGAFKTQVNNSLNTTVVGQDYIISPKIGGGYLYITNGGDGTTTPLGYVEIDPSGNHDSNAYMIRANYDGTDIFTINNLGQAFFNGAITVGNTPSASTTGFTVSQNGFMEASNATLYGSIYSSNGNIGGWIIYGSPTHKLECEVILEDSLSLFSKSTIQLDADNGQINSIGQFDYKSDGVWEYSYIYSTEIVNGHIELTTSYSSELTGYTYGMIIDSEYICGIAENNFGTYSGGYNLGFAEDISKTNLRPLITLTYSRNFSVTIPTATVKFDAEIQFQRYIRSDIIPRGSSALMLGAASDRWSTVYCTRVDESSDGRLKENIISVTNKYENMFMDMRPVLYNFKSDKNMIHLGFIAQEIESAMIKNNILLNEYGGLNKKEYETEDGEKDFSYGLSYSEITALNTHMIQKLYKRVEELEAEVASLKSK